MNKIRILGLNLFIFIVFVLVYQITFHLAEPKAYDFMTKNVLTEKLPFDNFKKVYGNENTVLVVIDAKTIERYRWPWKRENYAKIFDYFIDYSKPKVVVHDAIIASLDQDNPESDKKFFESVNRFENLVEGFIPQMDPWEDKNFGQAYDKKFLNKFGAKVVDKRSPSPFLYESLMTYPEPYLNVVKHASSVSLFTGAIIESKNNFISNYTRDQITRNCEYLFQYGDGYLTSTGLQVFLLANNNPEIVFTDKAIKFPGLKYEIKQHKTVWRSINPIKFYKLYDEGYSHKYYSAVDIIDSYEAIKQGKKPVINPEVFKDKIVLIGANVPAGAGLNDNNYTPLRKNHPGVDIVATTIDNIMYNDFVFVLPSWFNLLITILGMLSVYGFIRVAGLTKTVTSTLSIILGYLFLCIICFYFSIIINVITPIVMFVLTTILAYTHKFVLENKSKEKVKSAMGKYMSEDVMKRVIQNIDNLGLGGKKAMVTVLFSDIRGFTTMSEQMSAEQVSEILNEYFTEMEPIITRYNGVINKFIGDAVMAIFGEPIQDKNHAQNAVKCAYAMLERVKELQKKWVQEGKPKIEIGVGINTGEVFVGNIGSINRMEYTVIGDTVNLASRLESYNKTYKTKMLISTSTYEEVKGIVNVIRIPDVQIRGKAQKMDIYEVLRVEEI